MNRSKPLLLLTGVGVMIAMPLHAHHAFSAEYDRNKPVVLHGIVTRVEWMNPHAHFYVDVPEGRGKITNCGFELGSPNGLMKAGWNRYSLKKGDEVTVKGTRAKDGSNLVNASSIVMADGKMVLSGVSSGDDYPAK